MLKFTTCTQLGLRRGLLKICRRNPKKLAGLLPLMLSADLGIAAAALHPIRPAFTRINAVHALGIIVPRSVIKRITLGADLHLLVLRGKAKRGRKVQRNPRIGTVQLLVELLLSML